MYSVRPGSQEEQVGRLILAGVVIVTLPAIPFGNYLLYPFTILTTWFHEMGHGLTALLLGFGFDHLVILPDGSGYAETHRPADSSNIANALIGVGGPLGPTIAGSLLILASSRHQWWKPALLALAAAIALSTFVWVRSLTGIVVLPLVAAGLGWIAWKGRDWLQRFALQFLGVLGALSMFTDWSYLFTERTVLAGQVMYSDTGMIEQSLWLPHWIWAILIIALSGLMIGASLKYALAREG